jgi:hypothetical protein
MPATQATQAIAAMLMKRMKPKSPRPMLARGVFSRIPEMVEAAPYVWVSGQVRISVIGWP